MQNILVFGDVHANLPALTAVFKDMEQHGALKRFCLGDLVG
jgi:predicted phosphodiesterase